MKKKIFKTLTFIGIATLFVTTVSAIDNSLELKKDISFLESKIEINYKENLGTENGSLLVYSDKEKNEFIYKDGDLVAYIANDSILSTTQKNSLDNKIDVNKNDLLPVRSEKPLPKDKLADCMEEIKKIAVELPVKQYDIIINDILSTGINIVATKDLD